MEDSPVHRWCSRGSHSVLWWLTGLAAALGCVFVVSVCVSLCLSPAWQCCVASAPVVCQWTFGKLQTLHSCRGACILLLDG